MAVSLIAEVVAYVQGTDLTPAERLVLLLIAERANGATREAWQSNGTGGRKRWMLVEVSGLSETGVRAALRRLAARGLELRVPLGKDSSGRVVYALYGRQTTYRIPPLGAESGEPDGVTPVTPRGVTQNGGGVTPVTPRGVTQAPTGVTPVTPFSSGIQEHSVNNNSSAPRQIVLKSTDAKPSEADAVLARIRNENPNIRNLGAYVNSIAKAGELQKLVTEARGARIKAERIEADRIDRDARRGLPKCDHGTEGGEMRHSVTGLLRCGRCAKEAQFARPRPLRLVEESSA